jgi:NADH:ubiquinone oxidoreductase subunit F (NADH-binding)
MSPGTFLATITGGGRPTALYEFAWRSVFRSAHAARAGGRRGARGVDGWLFRGLLNIDILDATLDHESIRRLAAPGAARSRPHRGLPVAVAASVMSYFDRENAGQCGSCFNGTAAMAAVTSALRDGVATKEDLTRLERWSVVLRGRGACGTLDGATNVAASLLLRFPQLVARHPANDCPACRTGAFDALRPYEVEAVAQS